jgi:hypothetical protein
MNSNDISSLIHVHVFSYDNKSVSQRKKCLLFKHEKNNQTLSNDWPTYCHTRIHEHVLNWIYRYYSYVHWLVFPQAAFWEKSCVSDRNREFKIKSKINLRTEIKHFFLFNYVPHLFLLTCGKFHGKKIDNNNTLTHICLLPFFQMASYYVT